MGWGRTLRWSFPSFWGDGTYATLRKKVEKIGEKNDVIRPRTDTRRDIYRSLMNSRDFKWVYLEREYYYCVGAKLYPDRVEYCAYDATTPWVIFHDDDRVELTKNIRYAPYGSLYNVINIEHVYCGRAEYIRQINGSDSYHAVDSKAHIFLRPAKDSQRFIVINPIQEFVWKLNRKRAAEAVRAAKPFIEYAKALKGMGFKSDKHLTTLESINWLSEVENVKEVITSTGGKQLATAYQHLPLLRDIRLGLYYRWSKEAKTIQTLIDKVGNRFIPKFEIPEDLAYFAFNCYDAVEQPMGVPIKDAYRRVFSRVRS